jgi:hypothetical protein
MRSLPVSLAVSALAYGTAFTLAAWLFDGFRVEPLWLVAAIAIFMALTVALRRVLISLNRSARGYTIVGGLLLTFVALWLTDLLVPRVGFDIDGAWAWVGVTGLVWAAGVAYGEAETNAPAGTPGASP